MHYRLLLFCNILVVNVLVYTMELAETSQEEIVTLQLQDNEAYKLDLKIAQFSKTLSDLIAESNYLEHSIPLPNISQETMDWICEQLNALSDLKDNSLESTSSIDKFQTTVSKNIRLLNGQRVCELLCAVNYLDIQQLYNCLMKQCDVRKLSEDQLCSIPLDLCRTLILNDLVKDAPLHVGEEGLLSYCEEFWVISLCICDTKIISVSPSSYVRIFDLATGKQHAVFKMPAALLGGSFATNCVCADSLDKIFIGCGPTIRVLNSTTGNHELFCDGHTALVSSIALVNNMLISGSHDHTVRIWDINSGKQIGLLEGHTDAVTSLCVENNKIISGSRDGTVRVWDLTAKEELFIGKDSRIGLWRKEALSHGSWVTDVCTADNKIFSSSRDGTVGVWDLHTGKELFYCGCKRSETRLTSVCVGNKMIIAGSEHGTVYAWDLHTGKLLLTYESHSRWPKSTDRITHICAIGDKIVCGSNFAGQTISVWDLSVLKKFLTLNYVQLTKILAYLKKSTTRAGFSFREIKALIA